MPSPLSGETALNMSAILSTVLKIRSFTATEIGIQTTSTTLLWKLAFMATEVEQRRSRLVPVWETGCLTSWTANATLPTNQLPCHTF